MSKLDELIQELCPNGVEYKNLGELCNTITTGKLNANAMVENGEYHFYTCDSTPYRIDKYAFDEEAILISGNGSQVGHVNYYKGKFNAYQRTYVLYDFKEIHVKYLLHYLKGYLRNYIIVHSKKGSIPYITLPMLKEFKLPVPPLEVQCKIIRILDAFSLESEELITELSKELEYRQKQYEYYRNDLIKETNKVEYKDLTLEDILKIKNGKDYKHLREGKYPVYGTGGIISYVNGFMYNKPSILIPRKGSLEKLYYVEEPFWNVDTIFYTEIDENEAIPKYIYYYLQNEHLEKLNIAGGIPSLTKSVLNKVKIILPSKKVQKRIVEVLDNFERICSNFNIVLPAEIEERQKQYEYYRNLLLTFPEQGERIFKQPSKQASIIRLLLYVFGTISVRLDDIAEIYDGTHQTPKYTDSGVSFISVQNINDIYNSKKYISEKDYNKYKIKPQINDIFMTRIGSVGKCAVYNKEKDLAYYVSLALIRPDKEIVNSYYLKYLIESSIGTKELRKRTLVNAVPIKINKDDIGRIKLPIPSMEKQQKVVSILSKYDKLVNDISEYIPKEIELNNKKYEYYRDLLLNFKEVEK